MVALSVVLTFLFVILIDMLVLKFQGKTHPAFENSFVEDTVSIFDDAKIVIPKNMFLSKSHIWLKKLSKGLYQIGIDNFLCKSFTNMSFNKFPEPGNKLKFGDALFEYRVGNKTLKILSPVDGIVSSINKTESRDKIIDPYSQWQVIIQAERIDAQNNFLSGKKAAVWIKEEFKRLEDFVYAHSGNTELVGATMYDGGKPVESVAEKIIENYLEDFEKEFLKL